MCDHACSFHKCGERHVMFCCTYCVCSENIELSKMNDHLAECHNIRVEFPQRPNFPPRPIPTHEPIPAYAGATA